MHIAIFAFWAFISTLAVAIFLAEWLQVGEEWWIALLEALGFVALVGAIVAACNWIVWMGS